ncbi:hypothetical protein [Micromonospora sp. KC606]|uniref:hypothetical protein n=1 Tax=Micromonospora sp. KC606 TaxID=2530379 RepID=UPI001FB5CF1F|nr:hypothetical protein [Micromonospora sp. KC606]
MISGSSTGWTGLRGNACGRTPRPSSHRPSCLLLAEVVRLGADHAGAHARLFADAPGSHEAAAALAVQVGAVRLLAQLAAPIMPDFATRLWQALGEEGEPRWDGTVAIRHVRRVGTPPVLAPVPPQAATIGGVR